MKKVIVIIFAFFVFLGCEEKEDVKQHSAKEVDEPTKKESVKQEEVMDAVEKGLTVVDAWIRPAGKERNTGLFFRVINNTSENDTLLAAKSELAQKTEVHETYKEGEMMGMREVDNLVIEAGQVFEFKPMSYHIMLINLNEAMTQGNQAEVTLVFKNAGEVKVEAEVEDKMPTIREGKKHEM